MECPKCAAGVREVDTFCKRCHNTLRVKCPACGNVQRHPGKCDKCGIDLVKFATMLIADKRIAADRDHDRIERRSGLLKNVLLIPINGGLSLLRYFFGAHDV